MSTARQRQAQREEQSIEAQIAHMRARAVSDPKRLAWVVDQAARLRPRLTHSPIPTGQLQRHFACIKDPSQVDTPEKPADELTRQAITLVDFMGKNGLLTFEMSQAGRTYRGLWLDSEGMSKGVSSYGDYVASSEPSSRMLTSDWQLKSGQRFLDATYAAFGVKQDDNRWALDEELMRAVVPALLFDRKSITQKAIGTALTRYSGEKQTPAAGGTYVESILRRLSLHFRYRQR
jgi:hypothetical protein